MDVISSELYEEYKGFKIAVSDKVTDQSGNPAIAQILNVILVHPYFGIGHVKKMIDKTAGSTNEDSNTNNRNDDVGETDANPDPRNIYSYSTGVPKLDIDASKVNVNTYGNQRTDGDTDPRTDGDTDPRTDGNPRNNNNPDDNGNGDDCCYRDTCPNLDSNSDKPGRCPYYYADQDIE